MVRGRRLSRRLHHFLFCSLFWLRWRLGVSCLRFRIRPLQFSPRTVHRNSVDYKCRRVSTWIRWHVSTRPARWIDRLRWTLKTSFTASRGIRLHCCDGDCIHTFYRISTWISWHVSTRPARWIDRLGWTLKTSFTASRAIRSHCCGGNYIHTILPRLTRFGAWFIDLGRQLSTWIPYAGLCSLIHSWLKGFLEENKKPNKKLWNLKWRIPKETFTWKVTFWVISLPKAQRTFLPHTYQSCMPRAKKRGKGRKKRRGEKIEGESPSPLSCFFLSAFHA